MARKNPEFTVEDIVARLTTEVQRLQRRAAELRASPPPQLAIPLIPEAEQLRKFEGLIARTLADARPRTWLERLVYRLIPNQVSHNLLVIEILTNLFETYRTLTYECSDLRREYVLFRQQMEDGVESKIEDEIARGIKRDFALLQQENEAHIQKLEARIAAFESGQQAEANLLRSELAIMRGRLDHKAAAARATNEAATNPDPHNADWEVFYLEFENRFRGSRDDVKNKQRAWLPYIDRALAAPHRGGILDIGCGRGEWLELLREQGSAARGIDLNSCMVEFCRGLGLDVERREALEYLRSLPDNTLQLITGFHIIEHLPFALLRQILAEALRVLKPGGWVIFETPNPANVVVGSHTFYRDHTHRRPLPPASTAFLFETLGFVQTQVIELNPCSAADHLPPSPEPVVGRFNDFFYGPQDYGILAAKPVSGTGGEGSQS